MNFLDCLRSKDNNHLITDATFNAIKGEYEKLVTKYTETMGSVDSAIIAAQKIAETRIERAAAFKFAEAKQLVTTASIDRRLSEELSRRQSLKESGPAHMQELVGKATMQDVVIDTILEPAQRRSETISRELFSVIDDVMEAYGPKWFDLKNDHAGFKELLGRMIDGDTSDPMALSLRKATDMAHEMYNAAGGSMGKIENYAPQAHASSKVHAAGYEQWIADIEPQLDRSKFIDRETGIPMDDVRWQEVSRIMYDDISTDGRTAINRNANKKGQARDVWNSRQQARQLPFKDSESWFKYQEKYGMDDSDLMQAYLRNISGMARDIGIMQTMGPMPNGLMQHVEGVMLGSDVHNPSPHKQRLAMSSYNVLVGGSDAGVESPFYRTVAAAQNGLRAAMLGSASISALSDSVFLKMGADMYGLNGNKAVGNYLKSVANSGDRALVNSAAHNLEMALNTGINAYRLHEGNNLASGGNKVERGLAWASKSVHSASGLRAMTEATGDAISLELASTVSHHAANKTLWMDLDDSFKKGLVANNITELDWNIISQAESLEGGKGTSYITPEQVAAITSEPLDQVMAASRKLSDLDVQLRYLATNAPRLRTRAISSMGATHGTVNRAVASSVFMFKSFPMEVMQNFVLPSIAKASKGSVGSLATMTVGATMIGGMALLLGDLAAGREPREIDNMGFAKDALIKGGAGSFIADVMFADHGEYGRSYLMDFAGPMGSLLTDVASLIGGTGGKLFGDDGGLSEAGEHLNKTSRSFLRKYTPAQSLWYTRAAAERLIFENIDAALSPDFGAEMEKRRKRVEENQGVGMWWDYGKNSPF